ICTISPGPAAIRMIWEYLSRPILGPFSGIIEGRVAIKRAKLLMRSLESSALKPVPVAANGASTPTTRLNKNGVSAAMSHERYLPMTLPNKLAQLAEEAGEVVAAVGKTLRFGLDSENLELPDNVRETNRNWLKREIEDLKRAISKVEEFLNES